MKNVQSCPYFSMGKFTRNAFKIILLTGILFILMHQPFAWKPLESQNEKSSPKGVVVYLASPHQEANLKESLNLLYTNVLSKYNYPLILFHDPSYPKDMKLRFQTFFKDHLPGVNASFVLTNFQLPAHYDVHKNPVKVFPEFFPGYQLMIRFWFREIFFHPAMQEFDYYLRLDTDSFIHSPFPIDPFVEMHQKGYNYVYNDINPEWYASVVEGLYDWVDEWLIHHKTFAEKNDFFKDIPPKDKRNEQPGLQFYNNFEMVNIKKFKSKEILEFVNAIDKTNRIMTHRWGDAPLRYIQVNLYLDFSKEVWKFCHFKYEHRNHHKILEAC